MNYLSPGDPISAAAWNGTIAEADAYLTTALGGMSAVLLGFDDPWDRRFFFFDPVGGISGMNTIAKNFLTNNPPKTNQQAKFWRNYESGSIESFITTSLIGPAVASSFVIVNGGSGYQVGDLVTVVGGTVYTNGWPAKIQVTAINGSGAITAGYMGIQLSVGAPAGTYIYTDTPSAAAASTGGHGTGATFTINCTSPFSSTLGVVSIVDPAVGLLVDPSIDPGTGSAYTIPGSASWAATLYPSGYATPSDTNFDWVDQFSLDACLSVMSLTVSGTSYKVTTRSSIFTKEILSAEHQQPFEPIDVFINGNITWNSAWIKYPIVRVHNCAAAIVNIFGVSINPLGSRCFRLVSGNWVACGNYFHTMVSGDIRALQMLGRNKLNVTLTRQPNGPSLFMPGIVADIVQKVFTSLNAFHAPIPYFWDAASIYNNPAYTKQSTYEITPPVGGYCAQDQISSILGDLIVPKGALLAENLSGGAKAYLSFNSFGTLATDLAGGNISVQANGSNFQLYATSGAPHLIDIGSPLVTLLTGKPAASLSSPLLFPTLYFYGKSISSANASINYTFNRWTYDTSGNPQSGSSVTNTVNRTTASVSHSRKTIYLTDTGTTISNWLTSLLNSCGASVDKFDIFSTAFGPYLTYDELWPVNNLYPGDQTVMHDPVWGDLIGSAYSVTCENQPGGSFVRISRAVQLQFGQNLGGAAGGACWPVLDTIYGQNQGGDSRYWNFWHYARTSRLYQNNRWFHIDPTQSQWFPTPLYYVVSGFYLGAGINGQWDPSDVNLNFFNNISSHVETVPVSTNVAVGNQAYIETGLSRMGPFSYAPDIWIPFAAWYNGKTSVSYPNSSGSTSAISTPTNWYAYNSGTVLSNSTISAPMRNALPVQVEHFNAIASLVAAKNDTNARYAPINSGTAQNKTFSLSFDAASILVVNGGSGYLVNDSLNFNLKVGSVDANGAILTVAQNGSVVVNNYTIDGTAQRPFALGNSATGSMATCDTTSGSGAALNFIPFYKPIGVPRFPYPSRPVLGFYDSGGNWIQPSAVNNNLANDYWPRGAYFCWNGGTPGASDPVSDYFATLGIAVQTALPTDAGQTLTYGTALPLYTFSVNVNRTITEYINPANSSSYAYGCDGYYAVSAAAYRWVTIDDVRAYYSGIGLPFVLNDEVVPFSYRGSAQRQTPVPVTTFTPSYGIVNISVAFSQPPLPSNPPDNFSGGVLFGGTNTLWALIGERYAGNVYVINADFFNDKNGLWVRAYAGENICADGTFAFDIFRNSITSIASYAVTLNYNYQGSYVLDSHGPGPFPPGVFQDLTNDHHWWAIGSFYTETFSTGYSGNPPPGFSDLALTKIQTNLGYVIFLCENVGRFAVLSIPQNLAYYDLDFVKNNMNAVRALGTSVIPIICDNTIEANGGEVNIIDGIGGPGVCEHIITTGLLNARISTIAIVGNVSIGSIIGAGSTSSGAGSSAGIGSGGGSGGGL